MSSAEIKHSKKELRKLKKLVSQLKKNQAYYEDILANLPGHVYWLNKENVYLGCNNLKAQNVNLKSRKDIVGKTNFDMPWNDQAQALMIMQTGIPQTVEESAIFNNNDAFFSLKKFL